MNYQKPEGVPAGYTCYHGGGRGACPHRGVGPLGGGPCCTHFGNSMLYDVYKCPACLEACDLDTPKPRYSHDQ